MRQEEMDDLVQVKSAKELKPGLALLLTPCRVCGKKHWINLISSPSVAAVCLRHQREGLSVCPEGMIWSALGCIDQRHSCFSSALAEGRLWRLRQVDTEDRSESHPAATRDTKARANT